MFFNLLETFINTYDEETGKFESSAQLGAEERVVEILSSKPESGHVVCFFFSRVSMLSFLISHVLTDSLLLSAEISTGEV